MKFQFRYLDQYEAVLASVTTSGETFDLCKRLADAQTAVTQRRKDFALCRVRVIEGERQTA
jgi:hypothetical protein